VTSSFLPACSLQKTEDDFEVWYECLDNGNVRPSPRDRRGIDSQCTAGSGRTGPNKQACSNIEVVSWHYEWNEDTPGGDRGKEGQGGGAAQSLLLTTPPKTASGASLLPFSF
jgi:hypothetical protein